MRTRWYAVSIVPGKVSCEAVRRLGPVRWLAAEAPRFPVAGCDLGCCDCRYAHHTDRRSKPRRQVDATGIPRYYAGPERRTGPGDRRAD